MGSTDPAHPVIKAAVIKEEISKRIELPLFAIIVDVNVGISVVFYWVMRDP